ncbi:MAG: type II toxin-antitoxin system prevent-host-death family antitoxin, partial [Rhodospirillaceae bacterium]|nr:type II toxin-antitoxin system prevent-host-death family antitoxin [Rhodospirillaceae bacterium]
MDVAIHKAKAELTRLIVAAERGTRVVLTRHGKPVVELKPIAKVGGFDFSPDDPERATFGLGGPAVPVAADLDDPAFSRQVLALAPAERRPASPSGRRRRRR